MGEESKHQKAVVELLRLTPELRDSFFAPQNGAHLAGSSKQKAIHMSRLKAEGLRLGVSDLVIMEPILYRPLESGESLGLFLEMKRTKGGRISKSQAEWGEVVTERGYEFAVANGIDEAIEVIEDYVRRLKLCRRKKTLTGS